MIFCMGSSIFGRQSRWKQLPLVECCLAIFLPTMATVKERMMDGIRCSPSKDDAGFGLPGAAHEDDEARAVACALQLASEGGLPRLASYDPTLGLSCACGLAPPLLPLAARC